jgi:hypothetical protein
MMVHELEARENLTKSHVVAGRCVLDFGTWMDFQPSASLGKLDIECVWKSLDLIIKLEQYTLKEFMQNYLRVDVIARRLEELVIWKDGFTYVAEGTSQMCEALVEVLFPIERSCLEEDIPRIRYGPEPSAYDFPVELLHGFQLIS